VILTLLLVANTLTYDVLISAGHEGRPARCARFPKHHCNLGAAGERYWTPIVADAATAILRKHGVTVARLPADFEGNYKVDAAVFIHFDGASPPCSSAASIGYAKKSDAVVANAWRKLYGSYWPFGFEPDNFTVGLREYYAYKQVEARDAAMVIELGELTCPAQHAWLGHKLQWEGELLAYFLSRLIGRGGVPNPAPFTSRSQTPRQYPPRQTPVLARSGCNRCPMEALGQDIGDAPRMLAKLPRSEWIMHRSFLTQDALRSGLLRRLLCGLFAGGDPLS